MTKKEFLEVPMAPEKRREWMLSLTDNQVALLAHDLLKEYRVRQHYEDRDIHKPRDVKPEHSIDWLDLPHGIVRGLCRGGFYTIKDIMDSSPEMIRLDTRGIGPVSFATIKAALLKEGYDYDAKWTKKK